MHKIEGLQMQPLFYAQKQRLSESRGSAFCKPGKLKGLPHLRQSLSMVGMVCLGGFEPPAFTFGVCHSIP